mmetsp:Transcript_16035/g.23803  ORF Transcript_16035/g.23803 Transcript_16035/m.23803 type:complete len:121 (-) Transcript_16035:82-444(-)
MNLFASVKFRLLIVFVLSLQAALANEAKKDEINIGEGKMISAHVDDYVSVTTEGNIIAGHSSQCKNGIIAGEACCPFSCLKCGGKNCEGRPGGAENCCPIKIIKANQYCSDHEPPCRITL